MSELLLSILISRLPTNIQIINIFFRLILEYINYLFIFYNAISRVFTAIGGALYRMATKSYHLPNSVRQMTAGAVVGGFPALRWFCHRLAAISAKWS